MGSVIHLSQGRTRVETEPPEQEVRDVMSGRDVDADRLELGSGAVGAPGAIVGGIVLGALFVRRQLRLRSPLIDVRLFRIRAFSASSTIFGPPSTAPSSAVLLIASRMPAMPRSSISAAISDNSPTHSI